MATRDISAAIQNSLEDDVVYPFFAIEMLFDTAPIRLWTGYGTLVFEGTEYLGTGTLLDVSAIEGDFTASAYGSAGFTPDATSLDFKSYDQVTEAEVLAWVWASLDKAETEANLATQIEAQKAPVTVTGTPW